MRSLVSVSVGSNSLTLNRSSADSILRFNELIASAISSVDIFLERKYVIPMAILVLRDMSMTVGIDFFFALHAAELDSSAGRFLDEVVPASLRPKYDAKSSTIFVGNES